MAYRAMSRTHVLKTAVSGILRVFSQTCGGTASGSGGSALVFVFGRPEGGMKTYFCSVEGTANLLSVVKVVVVW